MNITLVKKATALTNPAIPKIETEKRPYKSFVLPGMGIDSRIATLVQGTGSSSLQISNHAKAQLRALPVSLATKLRWEEAGIAARAVYGLKLMTPKVLLENVAKGIFRNLSKIQTLEVSQGKGADGRITLGGLLEPGIRLDTLGEQQFAVASILEALIAEARAGNPKLSFLLSKATTKPPVTELDNQLARAIAEARLHPHIGCCGLERATVNMDLLK